VNKHGVRFGVGGRQNACPSAPEYRRATAEIARRLAERYRDHPAVVMWHVHNEYGAPLGECYCPVSVTAFQEWLWATYHDLDALNSAWGTLFWSQRYGAWEEVDAPRANHTVVNPAQLLDFARFTSAEHLACFTLQRDILREITPDKPVTTNFMTTNCKSMDLWKWAREVDVVANDHYLDAEAPDNHLNLAMAADLSRSLGRGQPWLLMEHSTSAVSWQPRNIAKLPGQMRRNSLAHVARGSDSVLFFQWRASRFGAEKFHSAMVPQAGTDSAVWRDVVRLGADLRKLEGVRGSRVSAEVAIAWDWESYWALELDWRPSRDLSFRDRMDAFYAALWHEHATVDFVHPNADLSGYRLLVIPTLYLLSETAAQNLHRFVASGGHLLVSFFSGIADEHDTVYSGPYPGALRDVLGLSIEEFHPLRAGELVELSSGQHGKVWSERIRPAGAVPLVDFVSGPDAGHPAITRHALGHGLAWYVASSLDKLRLLVRRVLDEAAVARPQGLPDGLEVVRRGEYLFLINHGTGDATVTGIHGLSVLDGVRCDGAVTVAGGEVSVIRLH
jgi:beta-galactosidase